MPVSSGSAEVNARRHDWREVKFLSESRDFAASILGRKTAECEGSKGNGQATKGSRWIPWHTEAMKDVVTCDKSRGAGNTL